MPIYRGPGGSGDAVNDSSSEATLVAQLVVEAQADADAADASATAAAGSASTASTQATSATNSATAAASSASSASSSASSATSSASSASTSATNAANSATAAQTAETAAELAETNAETAETNAASSASAASTSATNASNSASAASTSATNASNSATAASTSASNASTSATNAASSASSASTSASNASTSATNASNSATSASTSATTATTQAGIATTQASNASTSASNAATSATNASNSASTATTQATNASNSASAAATSETNAAASFDSFDDRYLGAKSSAPTLDNDGNTLLVGALYFNTVDSAMKVWNGTAWLDAYASLSGALIATNNLADLTNAGTARTNLGVAIGTNVQAWDADLDTWATKTAPSGTVVGTSDTQTLTNKTLTTPVISSITNTGTLTLPTSTDTLVGRATTDTLTNKTIALGSNTVSGTLAQFNTAVTDADLVSLAGTETLTNKTLTSPTLTTPALGTPASGVVTNLTGTASININGTVGATTASTGAFTTLGATGVATFSAGTAAAPAITTTGDTNTGIFFPAADTIAFTEGGVESMRIDSSGNVLVGTATAQELLTVNKNAAFGTTADAFSELRFFNSTSTAGTTRVRANAGALAFLTSNAEAMRIDASQNVGIGTSSPSTRLHVQSSTQAYPLLVKVTAGTTAGIEFNDPTTTTNPVVSSRGNGLTVETGGAERMRIDSSGNVGIGTSSPNGKLVVSETNRAADGVGNLNIFTTNSQATDNGGSLGLGGLNGSAGAFDPWVFAKFKGAKENSTSGNLSGYLAAYTSNSGGSVVERMRIDSSGNVGIGTSNPTQKLQVEDAGNVTIQLTKAGVASFAIINNGTAGTILQNEANPLIFNTSNTERMRINSSGDVLVGGTGLASAGNSYATLRGGDNNSIETYRIGTGTRTQIAFYNGTAGSAAQVGTIQTSGSNTSYNTSSDYRLKENIAPMVGALATVQALKPVTYKWKRDGSDGQGFIAHELQAIVPDCVSGEKDAVDENGKPEYQGVDVSFLVATLTAAIQEQQALIENLTTRLNALEGK